MNKKYRGIACIINVNEVLGMEPRHGTDVDRDRLTKLFQQLHFNVLVFNDDDGLQAEVSVICRFIVDCLAVDRLCYSLFALSEHFGFQTFETKIRPQCNNFHVCYGKKMQHCCFGNSTIVCRSISHRHSLGWQNTSILLC